MKEMEELPDEPRACPYCDEIITHRPYWNHIATKHPEEYENSRTTWKPLFDDYTLAGMDAQTSLMVMAELFNNPIDIIEPFLMIEIVKEKFEEGVPEEEALKQIAEIFGKSVAEVKKNVENK
ncbi:MAG: hypothetical protein ACFFCS_05475 [Candidatus Hodarchaeota archaeon]